ncbi:helix-turn-helix domain-containing protein [Corynebacterium mastitidis]|uniref:helix-turn-helix domain-containing protein n=1 Tax=Corynebacterium mastitidis TaxID=161890 RepID=UPI003D72A495
MAQAIMTHMSADEAIGLKVSQLLTRHRCTRKALGQALAITSQGVSRKIYGQTSWSIDDLYSTADFFGVDITDLLPRRVVASDMQESPEAVVSGDSRRMVAGAGFEPTTSGL